MISNLINSNPKEGYLKRCFSYEYHPANTYMQRETISILKNACNQFPRGNLILAENFNDSDSLYRLKGLSTQSTTSDEESQYGRIKRNKTPWVASTTLNNWTEYDSLMLKKKRERVEKEKKTKREKGKIIERIISLAV